MTSLGKIVYTYSIYFTQPLVHHVLVTTVCILNNPIEFTIPLKLVLNSVFI